MEEYVPTGSFKWLSELEHVPNGGIARPIVENWIGKFRKVPGNADQPDFRLTSLQSIAAEHPDTFGSRGKNLIITGPPSAGKTLIAEMLMANHFSLKKYPLGCIYAVPLKALATEKYERFRSVFGDAAVYVSSSDYQEYDSLILNTRFRIAVVIYEKLYSWLANRQNAGQILSRTSLVVVDELQMLAEPQRGAKLELIMTFLRDYQQRERDVREERYLFRIIGLGSSHQALHKVATWLQAVPITITDEQRPVPLVEGYLRIDGSRYIEPLPDRLAAALPDGELHLPEVTGKDKNRDELTLSFVSRALTDEQGTRLPAGTGKRILIYCADKDGSERMAERLSQVLGRRQTLDAETKTSVENLEATGTSGKLEKVIPSGVAFHHGDLNLEERQLVERMFANLDPQKSSLDVIVTTPTLSMGVNLPADYMLFSTAETYRQNERVLRGVQSQLLSPLEYKNFAGRAGRYKPNMPPDHHGVALFLTDRDPESAEVELVEGLIHGRIEPIEPGLHRWPYGLDPLALATLAWQSASLDPRSLTEDTMANVFGSTLAGWSKVSVERKGVRLSFDKGAVQTLVELADHHPELVRYQTGRFSLQTTGEAVASQGIDIVTYEILQKLSAQLPEVLSKPFVLLEELVQGREVGNLYPTRIPGGSDRTRLAAALRKFFSNLREKGEALGPIAEGLLSITYTPDPDSLAYLMRVVASWLWMEGQSAEALSKNPMLPGIRYGAVALLTDQLAWFMDALGSIWEGLGQGPTSASVPEDENREWSDSIHWSITRFERRLRYGLPEYLTSVAHLRVRGWHRQRLMELWENLGGWEHPVHLLTHRSTKVKKHLRPLFTELKDKVRKREWEDDPRESWEKQVSSVSEVLDIAKSVTLDSSWPDIITDLHWTAGRGLALAIRRALNAAPLSFSAYTREEAPIDAGVRLSELPDTLVSLSGPYYIGVVVAGSKGSTATWQDIRQALMKCGPDGRRLDKMICVVEGDIGDIDQQRRAFNVATMVLSREAFAQFCTRAVQALDDSDALQRVRTLIELPNRLLRTAQDVDAELNLQGSEFRPTGSLVGRGLIDRRNTLHKLGNGDSGIQAPDVAPGNMTAMERELRGGLTMINDQLDQILAESDTEPEEIAWIRAAADELTANPETCLVRCRKTLEGLLTKAYGLTHQGKPKNADSALTWLRDNGHLPEMTFRQGDSCRVLFNELIHESGGYTRVEIDGTWAWVDPLVHARKPDVLYAIICLVQLAKWYFNLEKELQSQAEPT